MINLPPNSFLYFQRNKMMTDDQILAVTRTLFYKGSIRCFMEQINWQET